MCALPVGEGVHEAPAGQEGVVAFQHRYGLEPRLEGLPHDQDSYRAAAHPWRQGGGHRCHRKAESRPHSQLLFQQCGRRPRPLSWHRPHRVPPLLSGTGRFAARSQRRQHLRRHQHHQCCRRCRSPTAWRHLLAPAALRWRLPRWSNNCRPRWGGRSRRGCGCWAPDPCCRKRQPRGLRCPCGWPWRPLEPQRSRRPQQHRGPCSLPPGSGARRRQRPRR
mmetsp:Transcript_100760/g.215998  ORF Transcript_100760/g.215998 Transcript_100760/m.215998 type:complete len:220 (-) Transcript_100760:646-1305(-)